MYWLLLKNMPHQVKAIVPIFALGAERIHRTANEKVSIILLLSKFLSK